MLQRALWAGLILVLIGVGGAGAWSLVRGRTAAVRGLAGGSSRLPVYGSLPDFSLIERSGRRVERLEFLGKIWVVDFMYTRCPDTCPLQSAEMARLQADLAAESDVRLASITVDPERDTPQVLSRYADRFKADHVRWLFLTGEKEAIYRLAQEGLRLPILDPRNKAGVLEPGPAMASEGAGRIAVLHSSRFVLVDRKARIRSYCDSTDADSLQRLRRDVKALLQEE
ncbi:MAG: SCO family protein [candidate division NC10 bacterium]|nr:SCO family protein [candidate division NC10 bacterium]